MKKLKCVVLIDDHKPTNILHRIAIEQTNKVEHIKTFISAEKALEYLLNTKNDDYIKPNVIFLDINMPSMNGWQFIEQYKNISFEKKSDIVLLMLSTSTLPNDIERAENEEEVRGYIYKPLTEERMLEVIEEYF